MYFVAVSISAVSRECPPMCRLLRHVNNANHSVSLMPLNITTPWRHGVLGVHDEDHGQTPTEISRADVR